MSYVLADRTTADKWLLTIDNGVLTMETTGYSGQPEPIIEDDTDAGVYWKVFIDNSMLSVESCLTEQDDSIEFDDATTGQYWRFVINEGVLGYTTTARPAVKVRVNVYIYDTEVIATAYST